MKVAIYQVNLDRDNENAAFRSYCGKPINAKLYDKVFDGEIPICSIDTISKLEDIYAYCNLEDDFLEENKMRSMSVSDVIEIGKEAFSFLRRSPYRGAWIEMIEYDRLSVPLSSLPIQGAWIEILLQCYRLQEYHF